ncbi:MAG: InlB B-repeat-containing protein, partial [Bacilli bacterium]
MKKVFLFLSLFLVSAFLVGCFEPKNIVSSIEVVSDEAEFDEGFQLSDLDVKVTMSDGTFSLVPLNESMISADDLAKFQEEGTHTIAVSYLNAATTFTISIAGEQGDPGVDGKEILLQVAEGYIQWQYEGDTTWTNLIALEALMGTSGTDGSDGKPTTFRVDSGFIQWQYVGDETWTNLMATADLIGLTGATGPAGANGTDGKQITFQVTAEYIQWQYVGDTTWTDLIALSALKGPAGADGVTPTIGISEDGYWVINGVKTTYKASGEAVAPVLLNVTFDPMGGTLPEGTPTIMTNVEKGSTIILPVPTNNGLIFEGWWTGDTVNDGKFTNATPVTKDITLYARWKTDYVPIETFLAIPTTTNFTADSLMVAEFVWGAMTGKFENTMNFKIYEEAGIIYTYENSTEKSFQNGVEIPQDARYFEGFNAYKQNQVFSLHRYELAGKWEIGVFEDNYEQEFPLGFIDPHKFVKRVGVNIYDYPLTEEELIMLTQNMDMGGKVIPSSAHCYLDLDAHKLVMAFNMEQMMEDGTKMTGSVSMEIVLTNPGLTTIELPLADTKTAALEMIDQVAASREEINFAKPESAQLFNDLVAQIKTKVTAVVSILELIDILPQEMPKIHMFMFEIDNLAQEKFYKIEQMTGYLESKKMLATAESVLAMTAIHDADVALLQSAISSEQINQIFNDYFDKIDAAYVVDEAKVQLMNYIGEQKNILSFYQNSLSQYLATMQDHEKMNEVVQNYMFLMQEASTIADVDLLFAQAITELKALQLAWLPEVTELPNQLIPYFTNILENIKPIIGENSALEVQMNAIIDAIKAEPNPLLQVDKFVVGYLQFSKDVAALVKTFALNRLEGLKNYFAEIVVPEDYDQLMGMYNQAVIDINARQDFWEIMSIVNQFESDAQYLQFDPVKQAIANLIKNLLQELAWFSETATVDSVVAMQTVVDTNIPLIEASTTVEQAEANYYVAFQALEAAYVIDPIKQALFDAIFATENEMLNLLDFLGQLILPVVMDEAWTLFDTFSNQLHNVTTIAELDVIYNEWYAKIELLDLTAGEYPLIQMRKDILDYANELHEIIVTTVDPLPVDFEANFTAFVAMVNSTTNALVLYNQGNPYIEGLQALAIEAFRADFLVQLQDQFYYFASIVLDSEMPTLQAKYDAFVISINEAIDQWEIENLFYSFIDFASGLEEDPVKADRMSFINNAHYNLQQWLETANAESSLALVALFDAFIVDINALVDYSEMNTRYYELMDAFDATYIPDYDKVTLIFTKNECMNKVYQFVGEYVQQVALEPDYAGTLYEKINELKHTIFDAPTLTEVFAACTNIMAVIDVPFPIDSNKVEPYRDGIISTIYYEFNNLYSYLPSIPATLANE